MSTLWNDMRRDQLLIAAFFSTPKHQRLVDPSRSDRDACVTPEQITGAMMISPSLTLGDLSTEGLRSYAQLHGSTRLAPEEEAKLQGEVAEAKHEAIRAMGDTVA